MPHSHHHSVHHAAPHSTGCLGLLGHCSAPWDDVAQAQPARGEVALQRWHSGRLLHPGGNGQRKRADRTPGALKGFLCESLFSRVEAPAMTLRNVLGGARRMEFLFAAQRMLAIRFRWEDEQACGLPCQRKTPPSMIGTRCISMKNNQK